MYIPNKVTFFVLFLTVATYVYLRYSFSTEAQNVAENSSLQMEKVSGLKVISTESFPFPKMKAITDKYTLETRGEMDKNFTNASSNLSIVSAEDGQFLCDTHNEVRQCVRIIKLVPNS